MVITDMGSDHYCLRWNNHQNNLLGVFSQLLQEESLVDVTLACSEGPSIRAHKVVLSACSSYFQSLFLDHPSRHPIIILKDVCFSELRTLVEFMYRGEVNIEYCRLPTLLKTAESLQVKGLAEMTHLPPPNNLPPPEMPPPGNSQPSVITTKETNNPLLVSLNNPRRGNCDDGGGSRRTSSPGSLDDDEDGRDIVVGIDKPSVASLNHDEYDRSSMSPDPEDDDASPDRSSSGYRYIMPRTPCLPPVQDAPIPLIKQELGRATDDGSVGGRSTPEDGRRSTNRYHEQIKSAFEFPVIPFTKGGNNNSNATSIISSSSLHHRIYRPSSSIISSGTISPSSMTNFNSSSLNSQPTSPSMYGSSVSSTASYPPHHHHHHHAPPPFLFSPFMPVLPPPSLLTDPDG